MPILCRWNFHTHSSPIRCFLSHELDNNFQTLPGHCQFASTQRRCLACSREYKTKDFFVDDVGGEDGNPGRLASQREWKVGGLPRYWHTLLCYSISIVQFRGSTKVRRWARSVWALCGLMRCCAPYMESDAAPGRGGLSPRLKVAPLWNVAGS